MLNVEIRKFHDLLALQYFQLLLQVDIREAIKEITINTSIVLEEGEDPVPALELNGNLVLPALVPIMFTPTAGKGKTLAVKETIF